MGMLARVGRVCAGKLYQGGVGGDLKILFRNLAQILKGELHENMDTLKLSHCVGNYYAVIGPLVKAHKAFFSGLLAEDRELKDNYNTSVVKGLSFNPDNPNWLVAGQGTAAEVFATDDADDYDYGDDNDYDYGDDNAMAEEPETLNAVSGPAQAPDDVSWVVRKAAISFLIENWEHRDQFVDEAMSLSLATICSLTTSTDANVKTELFDLLKNVVVGLEVTQPGFSRDQVFCREQVLKDIAMKIFDSWATKVNNLDLQTLTIINKMVTLYPGEVANFYGQLWEVLSGCLESQKTDLETKGHCLDTIKNILSGLSRETWSSDLAKISVLSEGLLKSIPKNASDLLIEV
jgi:hypothetical protein